jgi:glycosyltransferase involved in cell wall biosynthesis
MRPVLSIITVTRNCSSTLGDTLSSIKLIKNSNIEYIVIDGASTDGTASLIKSTPFVDTFVSEIDSGIYNAMNKGINLASGKYILFINGDDQVLPDGLKVVLSTLELGSADVYCANTIIRRFDGTDDILAINPWKLLFFNSAPHPSSFVRTDILKKFRFREDLKIAADYDLFLRLFIAGKKFEKIKVESAIHSRGGASRNSILSTFEVSEIRKKHLGPFFYILEFALKINRYFKKIVRWILGND